MKNHTVNNNGKVSRLSRKEFVSLLISKRQTVKLENLGKKRQRSILDGDTVKEYRQKIVPNYTVLRNCYYAVL